MASNLKLIAFAVLALAVLAGLAAYLYTGGSTVSGEERVFYVVAYHWGFAFYDENFNEVSKIVVNRGDRVTIYLIPGAALNEEAHEVYEERTIERGIGDLPPGSPEIVAKMEEAEDEGLLDHGLTISDYDVDVRTNHELFSGEASSISEVFSIESGDTLRAHSITFTADKPGSFDIICSVFCGYGHGWMVVEGGFVVQG